VERHGIDFNSQANMARRFQIKQSNVSQASHPHLFILV
jgi:hypothetical protein